MKAQEANKAEISEHLVQPVTSKLASHSQVLVLITCAQKKNELLLYRSNYGDNFVQYSFAVVSSSFIS